MAHGIWGLGSLGYKAPRGAGFLRHACAALAAEMLLQLLTPQSCLGGTGVCPVRVCGPCCVLVTAVLGAVCPAARLLCGRADGSQGRSQDVLTMCPFSLPFSTESSRRKGRKHGRLPEAQEKQHGRGSWSCWTGSPKQKTLILRMKKKRRRRRNSK